MGAESTLNEARVCCRTKNKEMNRQMAQSKQSWFAMPLVLIQIVILEFGDGFGVGLELGVRFGTACKRTSYTNARRRMQAVLD